MHIRYEFSDKKSFFIKIPETLGICKHIFEYPGVIRGLANIE